MTHTPLFENWRVDLDGMPFDVTLDLAWGEAYPVRGAPWFFGVRVPMADRQEDGTPPRDEARRLDMVENRIRALLRGRDGIYVGRRTGGNNRDLLFYLPDRPRGVEDRIRASVGMEILFISRRDAGWMGYEQLLPTAKDWHQIDEQKRIEDLVAQGFEVDSVYEIVHTISTPIMKGAEALSRFCQKLELDGITIEGEAPNLRVTARHLIPLRADVVCDVSWLLLKKSPKAKGEYEGWEAFDTATEVTESPETDEDLMALLTNLTRSD